SSVVKARPHFSNIHQLVAAIHPELQCSECRLTFALSFGVADDNAVGGAPLLDLEPVRRSLPGHIDAVSFLGHDAFKPVSSGGFEKPCSIVNRLTRTISRIGNLDRINHPGAATGQRFIDNGATVNIETIENIANRWMPVPSASHRSFISGMQSLNNVFEERLTLFVQTNNLYIEQAARGPKRLVGNLQLGEQIGDVTLGPASNCDFALV